MSATTKRRAIACVLIPLVVGFGLCCKYYRGFGSDWVNNWGPASVAYELLLMLIVFAVVPRCDAVIRIAIGVLVVTCLLEFLQLWHPDWLEAIRSTLVGRLALGTTFSWWDFPAYVVGCALGVLLLRSICNSARASAE